MSKLSDVRPVLYEVEAGKHLKWKDIADHSPLYKLLG
jgi:hypothetical protein